ncbi:hypothetical protein GCM10010298_24570 [Streptomyces microflavus]|uniref:Uncharacterized protein n=1 Tax=Streptomyces microflavus TaxID=1919 RepID=A0A7J0D2Z6_STRMI|nr:hypothetical protein Smic_76670 [Streptomyces microflavus]GGX58941.1 hypothetical protein GCM10010298_24570 [Streptomyces microflavus]
MVFLTTGPDGPEDHVCPTEQREEEGSMSSKRRRKKRARRKNGANHGKRPQS